MPTVTQRDAGRYEVQELEFGMVYKWRPERVIVECDCGARLALTASSTTCDCGADYRALVREELSKGRLEDQVLHPWRYAGDRENAGLPF